MSQKLKNEILEYCQTLPEWQKILAAGLFVQFDEGVKPEQIRKWSYEQFLFDEGIKTKAPEIPDFSLPTATFIDESKSTNNCVLTKIKNLKNVNALAEGQEIPILEKGITLIYGRNASGKSGFGRVFNNAFCSHGESLILGNIYDETEDEPYQASFEFANQDESYSLDIPVDKKKLSFKPFLVLTQSLLKFTLTGKITYISPQEN